MSQWLNQIQREAMNRAVIGHHQRERAAMGLHGIGDNGGQPANGNPVEPGRGRPSTTVSTETHTTTVREGVTPTGQHFRVTVNETVIPAAMNANNQPSPVIGQLSAVDVHNILRGADAGQATLAMTNAMQRSASGTSLAGGSLAPNPGVTTPYFPRASSRPGSGRATPDPSSRTPSGGSSNLMSNILPRYSSTSTPEVYILSSPQGPRALLINNNSETYYTPPARMSNTLGSTSLNRFATRQRMPWPTEIDRASTPQPQQQAHQRRTPQEQQPTPVQQQQQEEQPNLQQRRVPQAHPRNPGIAPLVAQVWPHFWLLIRLGIFVWWFTSGDSSWSRWATVIAIAIGIFVFNTGILNGVADQAWRPLRRHMENLLPLAEPNQIHNPPVIPPGGAPGGQRPNRQPNPADTAARLVAQRRQVNANWFISQARRIERAGLLFLASIAPGVAERHIAHLEAEARTRREAEEAAAAAAAAAAAVAEQAQENPSGTEGDAEKSKPESSQSQNQQDARNTDQPAVDQAQPNEQQPPMREGPLIAL
jgi:hypothetical protein